MFFSEEKKKRTPKGYKKKLNRRLEFMIRISKKMLISLFCVVLLAGSAYAVWQSVLTSQGVYDVTSESPHVSISQHFSGDTLDTQYDNVTVTDTLTLSNTNSPLEYEFAVIETRTDNVSDSCDDYSGDCEITYNYNGTDFTSGTIFLVQSGNSNLTTTMTCARYSCPQEITLDWTLTGQI
jgi:hypothetical protein